MRNTRYGNFSCEYDFDDLLFKLSQIQIRSCGVVIRGTSMYLPSLRRPNLKIDDRLPTRWDVEREIKIFVAMKELLRHLKSQPMITPDEVGVFQSQHPCQESRQELPCNSTVVLEKPVKLHTALCSQ